MNQRMYILALVISRNNDRQFDAPNLWRKQHLLNCESCHRPSSPHDESFLLWQQMGSSWAAAILSAVSSFLELQYLAPGVSRIRLRM
jgi:hypothetical protein